MKKELSVIIVLLMGIVTNSLAQKYHSDKLIPVADLGKHWAIGVSVNSDNRLFVSFPKKSVDFDFALTAIINGKRVPYPNEDWNKEGNEGSHFVNVMDLYVDAKDFLWVLDSKPSPSGSIFGGGDNTKPQDGQFKLVKINTKNNQVDRVYTLDDLDKAKSGLNDIRVDVEKNLAYLSDPGQAAIIVLDLKTGNTRKVLEKTKFTQVDPDIVLTYDGVEMRNETGKPFSSNVNGIALTKDFKYFYFKPINKKHLFRIETKYLADASLSDAEIQEKVEDMGEVGITHGLLADAKGNIYLTNSMDYSLRYLSPDGKIHTLVQDSRLLWPDSMGIGTDGYLYLSCSQIQLAPQWNNGVDKQQFPYRIYKIKLP